MAGDPTSPRDNSELRSIFIISSPPHHHFSDFKTDRSCKTDECLVADQFVQAMYRQQKDMSLGLGNTNGEEW